MAPSQRRQKVIRRTTVPADSLASLGGMIRFTLNEEHIRWRRAKKNTKSFSIQRVCVATGIPFTTMTAYLQGKRQPTILDLRDICKFAGVSMESILEVIPSRIDLDQAWKETQAAKEADDEELEDEGE